MVIRGILKEGVDNIQQNIQVIIALSVLALLIIKMEQSTTSHMHNKHDTSQKMLDSSSQKTINLKNTQPTELPKRQTQIPVQIESNINEFNTAKKIPFCIKENSHQNRLYDHYQKSGKHMSGDCSLFTSSLQPDFSELQSCGVLILNDQREIIKCNNQFLYFQELLKCSQSQIEAFSKNKDILVDQILEINLRFDQLKRASQSAKQKNGKHNLYFNNITESNLELSQLRKLNYNNNPQAQQQQQQQQQYQLKAKQQSSSENNIGQVTFHEQREQKFLDQSIQIHIQDLEESSNPLNANYRNSQTQQLICANCLNQSVLSNSPFNFHNIHSESKFAQLSNIAQNKPLDLSEYNQCVIPGGVYSLFQSTTKEVRLEDVINSIINSSPDTIQSPEYYQSNPICCQSCEESIEVQNKKFFIHKNPSNKQYKFLIHKNYLIISLQYRNQENLKKIIELKIGCFKNRRFQQETSQFEKQCEFCKQKNTVGASNDPKQLKQGNKLIAKRSSYSNEQSYNQTRQVNNHQQETGEFSKVGSLSQIGSNTEIMGVNSKNKRPIASYNENNEDQYLSKNYQNWQTSDTTQLKQKDQLPYEYKGVSEENQYIFSIEVMETNFEVVSKNLKAKMDKFRSKMLCSISHELRTPLNCIITMLDILNMKNDVCEMNKNLYINPALFSSYILLNTVNDILDMAEVNRSGQIKMIFSEFSPINLCCECLNFIKLQAKQKNIMLNFIYEDSVPQLIYTDQNKTRQVILNLLSNALKFTQKGSVSIKLSYILSEEMIKVDVSDTGCGIPEQKLNQIFCNFTKPEYENQQYSSNKENIQPESNISICSNTQNAGLGLNISYLLASCLGDDKKLEVKSKIGEGSTFSFYIKNRSQKQKGCTIQPKNNLSSYNSAFTKMQVDSDFSECHNGTSTKYFEKQHSDNYLKEIDESKNDADITFKSNSETNLKIPDSQIYLEKQQRYTFGTAADRLKPSSFNKSNYIFHHSNFLNSHIHHINNKSFDGNEAEEFENGSNNIQELFPENAREQVHQKPITKSRQATILQNNFNKTALQIIQQASNLHNYIYSQRDFSEDQINLNQQNRNPSGITQSPQITQEYQQQSRLTNSKRASISDDECNHPKVSSNNSIRLKNLIYDPSKSKQNDTSESSPTYRRISINHYNVHINSPTRKNGFPSKITSSNQSNIENVIENEGNAFTDQGAFKINFEESNHISSKQNHRKKQNSRPISIESCDIMNDSFEKKQPNYSSSINIGQKPKTLGKKFLQKNAINIISQKSIDNIYQLQVNSAQGFIYPNIITSSDIVKSNQTNQASLSYQNLSQNSLNHIEISKSCVDHSLETFKPLSIKQEMKEEIIKQNLVNLNKQRKCKCAQILIVDDNEFNLYALEVRLQLYQFTVDKASSGFECLEFIKRKKDSLCCKQYTLVFMDIDMPEMNGYETTEQIFLLCKKLKTNPPIISACSAYIQEQEKQLAFKTGMKYYITKPINTQSFENVLNTVFQSKK